MAFRQRSNQENASSRFSQFSAKSALAEPVRGIQKRRALGEIGNKLPSIQTNITVKKNGAPPEQKITLPSNAKSLAQGKSPKKNMLPTQTGAKKVTAAAIASKETKTMLDKMVDMSLKPGLKSQECVLNQFDKDEKKASDEPKSYSSNQLDIVDPDRCSTEPAMVREYVVDIFVYMRNMEMKFPVRENFLEGHSTAPWMRTTLIDWLVGVHSHFSFHLETLHLCVAITDRYLQENKHVDRHVLQLVGISSLMIAAKYEEMFLPSLAEFVDICSHTYSKRQILTMERTILKQLDFSLGRPLSVHFLRRYNKIAKVQSENHSLGKFMLELALLKYEASHIPPSLIAAAACCLSMGILGDVEHIEDLQGLWTPTLVHYTTYKYADFEDILVVLSNILVENESSKFQRIRRKYSAPNQNRISLNSKLKGSLMRQLTATKSSDEESNLLDVSEPQ